MYSILAPESPRATLAPLGATSLTFNDCKVGLFVLYFWPSKGILKQGMISNISRERLEIRFPREILKLSKINDVFETFLDEPKLYAVQQHPHWDLIATFFSKGSFLKGVLISPSPTGRTLPSTSHFSLQHPWCALKQSGQAMIKSLQSIFAQL